MACSNEYSLESLDRGGRAVVCRRSARRTVARRREALIAIVACLALFVGATSAHAQSYPAPSWSSVLGTFIPIESSDLAGLASSLPGPGGRYVRLDRVRRDLRVGRLGLVSRGARYPAVPVLLGLCTDGR